MADRFVPLVAQERADLLGFLARTGGDDWSRPTRCAAWTVKDVLAHLVDGELLYGRTYRGEMSELSFSDAANEASVENWRALPGVAVRGALWQHGTATQRVMDALPVGDWNRPVRLRAAHESLGIPETELPLRAIVRIHLHELCVHGNDITEALGAPPIWSDRLPAVAGYLLRAASGFLAGAIAPDTTIAVQVPDAGRIVLAGRRGRWEQAPEADAATTLEIDAETLVLATAGRVGVEDAVTRSLVKGDVETATGLLAGWRAV